MTRPKSQEVETVDVTDPSSWGVAVSVSTVGGPADGEAYDVPLPFDRRVMLPKVVYIPFIKPLPPINKKTGLMRLRRLFGMAEYRLGQQPAIGGGVEIVYRFVRTKRKKASR